MWTLVNQISSKNIEKQCGDATTPLTDTCVLQHDHNINIFDFHMMIWFEYIIEYMSVKQHKTIQCEQ